MTSDRPPLSAQEPIGPQAPPLDLDAVVATLVRLDYLHVGLDGELFFAGARQSLLRQYPRSFRSVWSALRWRTRLLARARHAERAGARMTILIIPEKATIYPDRIEGRPLRPCDGLANQVTRALSYGSGRRHILDLVGPFRTERDRLPLYLQTDSHWTHAGAFHAYRQFCERHGATPRARLHNGTILREEILCGDLGRVAQPPRTETFLVRDLVRDGRRIYANSLVLDVERQGEPLLLGEGAHVVFRNTGAEADPRRVIVFGDSYCHHADSIRSGGLTRLLAETFREVHFIWTTGYDASYVAKVKPDLVLCEIAERYLSTRPPRRFVTPV